MSADLREIADERALDAAALLKAKRFSAAYYLAGYATECALKAVALKDVTAYAMPDKDLVVALHTHDFDKLVARAQLREVLNARLQSSTGFSAAWSVVNSWTEASRYELWNPTQAADMVAATLDREEGVLPWVKTLW